MSTKATMDKIVTAEKEAANKRLEIEKTLQAARQKVFEASVAQMNQTSSEWISKMEGDVIRSVRRTQAAVQQTFSTALPPKPGGGAWTVQEAQRITPGQAAALW